MSSDRYILSEIAKKTLSENLTPAATGISTKNAIFYYEVSVQTTMLF